MTPSTTPLPTLLDPARFEREIDGKPVRLFQLRNSRGMLVGITNYGAKIEQVLVPDRNGKLDDVVLGYDSIDGVVGGASSVGAFVGRYAGRIANAQFSLGGREHVLTANNGPHCLHGGLRGTPFRVFDAVQRDSATVEMNYVFADGEEGFPGTLSLRLVYQVTEANELVLDYEAVAHERPTVASFTTHSFFNLEGEASRDVLGHEVMIPAAQYFGMTPQLIATGELLPVDGTVFDLREPVTLASRIGQPHPEGAAGIATDASTFAGYDDCLLLKPGPGQLTLCARVYAPESGRVMDVLSTEPALQFYTGVVAGQALAGGAGKLGRTYLQQQSLCLEPQGYPNAPNLPHFASSVHEPGRPRSGSTVYRFGTRSA